MKIGVTVILKESRPGVTTEESPWQALGSRDEILRGVYPEPKNEILRVAQDDRQAKGSG